MKPQSLAHLRYSRDRSSRGVLVRNGGSLVPVEQGRRPGADRGLLRSAHYATFDTSAPGRIESISPGRPGNPHRRWYIERRVWAASALRSKTRICALYWMIGRASSRERRVQNVYYVGVDVAVNKKINKTQK